MVLGSLEYSSSRTSRCYARVWFEAPLSNDTSAISLASLRLAASRTWNEQDISDLVKIWWLCGLSTARTNMISNQSESSSTEYSLN